MKFERIPLILAALGVLALCAGSATAGTVHVSAGTYTETDIVIDKAVTIQGTISGDGDGTSDSVVDLANDGDKAFLIQSDNVTIQDMVFTGTEDGSNPAAAVAIEIQDGFAVTNLSTITVTNVFFNATGTDDEFWGIQENEADATGSVVAEKIWWGADGGPAQTGSLFPSSIGSNTTEWIGLLGSVDFDPYYGDQAGNPSKLDTVYVAENGDDANSGADVANAVATIAHALTLVKTDGTGIVNLVDDEDAASVGSGSFADDGIAGFQENGTVTIDFPVTIRGFDGGDENQAILIDAHTDGVTFVVTANGVAFGGNNKTLTIENFGTITSADTPYIELDEGASPSTPITSFNLTDCIFKSVSNAVPLKITDVGDGAVILIQECSFGTTLKTDEFDKNVIVADTDSDAIAIDADGTGTVGGGTSNFWGTISGYGFSTSVAGTVPGIVDRLDTSSSSATVSFDFDPWQFDSGFSQELEQPENVYVDDGLDGGDEGSTGGLPAGANYVGYDAFSKIQDAVNNVIATP